MADTATIRNRIFVIFPLLLVFLTSCQTTNLTATPKPTDTEPAPTITETIPPPIQLLEAEEPNSCLECHEEKQNLIDTAKPEVEVVSESKGEG